MKLTVLLFASWADAAGSSAVEVELPEGATVAECVRAVRARPGLERVGAVPLVAVNRRYARQDEVLAVGDEVALIPPVAGG